MALILVFFGPPGAGKGSIAKLFQQHRGVPHLSTGDLIRAELADPDSDIAGRIRAVVESGGLVDDDTVEAILAKRIAREKLPIIIDGFPRNLRQAGRLDDFLAASGRSVTAAVFFDIPDTVIVQRLSNRRSCPVCGAVYNLLTVPPKREGVCDHDQARLIKRPDDTPEAVRRRLQVYREETSPLVDYYRERGKLVRLNAVGGPEKVYHRLLDVITDYEGCLERGGRIKHDADNE